MISIMVVVAIVVLHIVEKAMRLYNYGSFNYMMSQPTQTIEFIFDIVQLILTIALTISIGLIGSINFVFVIVFLFIDIKRTMFGSKEYYY